MEVDQANENQAIQVLVFGLATMLIFIFVITMILWFFAFKPTDMHEIVIVNNCKQAIYLLVGSATNSGTEIMMDPVFVLPHTTKTYWATPNVYFIAQGYYESTTIPKSTIYPLTKAKIWLNSRYYTGPAIITDGSKTLEIAPISYNSKNDHVYYDVSMQAGFNIPITIEPTANFLKIPLNDHSCQGPTWNQTGVNSENGCPPDLKEDNICLTPCTQEGLGCCTTVEGHCNKKECSAEWESDYYAFYNACPSCLITNCDEPLYICDNTEELISYTIVFCSG